jgi:hypothetical protein
MQSYSNLSLTILFVVAAIVNVTIMIVLQVRVFSEFRLCPDIYLCVPFIKGQAEELIAMP